MKDELNYYKNKKIELENLKKDTKKINLLDEDLNSKIKECNKIIKKEEGRLENLILLKNKIDSYKDKFKNSKKTCLFKTIGFSISTTLISSFLASANPAVFATFPLFSSFAAFSIIEVLVYFNETKNLRKLVKTTNYGELQQDIKNIENTILNQHKKIKVYETAKNKYNRFLDEKEKEMKRLNGNIKINYKENILDIDNTVKTK